MVESIPADVVSESIFFLLSISSDAVDERGMTVLSKTFFVAEVAEVVMMDVDDVGSMEASVGVNFFSDGVVGKVVG